MSSMEGASNSACNIKQSSTTLLKIADRKPNADLRNYPGFSCSPFYPTVSGECGEDGPSAQLPAMFRDVRLGA